MNINDENKQAIHEVMIADMQTRLDEYYEWYGFIDGKPYVSALESLVDDILHTDSIAGIHGVMNKFSELFPNEYLTLDDTLNYIFALLRGHTCILQDRGFHRCK